MDRSKRVSGEGVGRADVDATLEEGRYRYEYTARQIEREDGLANYRLTWTLQLNGFLFAALALIGKGMPPDIKDALKDMLPIAGIAVSLAGLAGTIAVLLVIRNLKIDWESDEEKDRWPKPTGTGLAYWLGLLTNILVPGVLFVVWSFLLHRFAW